MILSKYLCKMLGHKWRRLTKKEREQSTKEGEISPSQLRICKRCSAERRIRARKTTKQETK